MRGFGDTESVPIDATRGLRDWADDTHALVRALGIERPVHLAGWSTGGAAIAAYAMDHGPVASLTLIDPVSPYGFGGVKADGTPCFEDWAGSGGGTGSPEFAQRLAAGDRSTESPASPRNVMNTSYWSSQPPRARRARGAAARRDPQVAHRRRRLPGRLDELAELAGRRARARAGSSTRCRGATATGRHRRAGSQAPDPLDARQRRHRHRRRLGLGDGDAGQDGRGARLAGRGGLPAAADGDPDPHGARALPRRRAAACRSSSSRAPATARRSTPRSAGARCSSSSSTPAE